MPLRPFVSSFQKYVDVIPKILRPSYGNFTAADDENASKHEVHKNPRKGADSHRRQHA